MEERFSAILHTHPQCSGLEQYQPAPHRRGTGPGTMGCGQFQQTPRHESGYFLSGRGSNLSAGKQTPPARGTYRQYGSPQSLPYKVQRYVRQLYRQGFTCAYP